MATHSSILALRIPWTEEPSGLQPMGQDTTEHARTHTHTQICRCEATWALSGLENKPIS